MTSRPLLSFVLVSYKQEPYIREAVAGAFAQSYSPLELIISDDCSPDRTFEIIQEMVEAYKGPHRVILNRNPTNLGICGNLNRAVELSSGELIVGAAGDDISMPNRCERLAEEWVKPGRRWHSVVSDAEVIDAAGQRKGIYQNIREPRCGASLDKVLESGIVGVAGCCHAFSRDNYRIFGPIHPKAPGEDEILGFRSMVLGGILWIPDVLLLYRRHDECLYKDAAALKRMNRSSRIGAIKEDEYACVLRHKLYREYIEIASSRGILAPERCEEYTRLLDRRYPYYEYRMICKYSLAYSAIWLAWRVMKGEYRRGMFTLLKCNHIRFGIRSNLRRLRGKFR